MFLLRPFFSSRTFHNPDPNIEVQTQETSTLSLRPSLIAHFAVVKSAGLKSLSTKCNTLSCRRQNVLLAILFMDVSRPASLNTELPVFVRGGRQFGGANPFKRSPKGGIIEKVMGGKVATKRYRI